MLIYQNHRSFEIFSVAYPPSQYPVDGVWELNENGETLKPTTLKLSMPLNLKSESTQASRSNCRLLDCLHRTVGHIYCDVPESERLFGILALTANYVEILQKKKNSKINETE